MYSLYFHLESLPLTCSILPSSGEGMERAQAVQQVLCIFRVKRRDGKSLRRERSSQSMIYHSDPFP